MLRHAKKPLEIDIPRNIEAVKAMYRKSLSRLITQNKNGKSFRAIARKISNISDPTVGSLIKYPDRNVSRKVMIKVIRATTKPKKKKILESTGLYFRIPPCLAI